MDAPISAAPLLGQLQSVLAKLGVEASTVGLPDDPVAAAVNRPEVKIMTIEDPVEYTFPGMVQNPDQ